MNRKKFHGKHCIAFDDNKDTERIKLRFSSFDPCKWLKTGITPIMLFTKSFFSFHGAS